MQILSHLLYRENWSSTTKYQHTPSGFAYKVVCEHPNYTRETVIYTGENVIHTFLEALINEEKDIIDVLKDKVTPTKIGVILCSERYKTNKFNLRKRTRFLKSRILSPMWRNVHLTLMLILK